MKYTNTLSGSFISRPNRFIAKVNAEGAEQTVHVKNTGRCKELLIPNAKVVLQKSDNPNRKTAYDLIAVYKGSTLINMDSQAPNKAVYEWLKNGELISNPTFLKPEAKYGSSRLDFYLENKIEKCFVEVKGVTLEMSNTAIFPDAPTERGRKHITELIKAKKEGYKAAIIFVVQMKGCTKFMPNYETDTLFANELKKAYDNDVEIIAVDCKVTEDSMIIDKKIEVCL
ncbi:MAG: DNA/RNA nuclease SfsA [Acetobacter sp.]|nr:DNA/RNA nuclease SfsA [Bacteroides sp.]MCM1341032.1 DNA/RNA nuclease SfsA [Acetobacter sp.]MCM1432412.1 DNA/RNA nuclease SfsA [Clostridiales bacterium]